MIDRVSDFLETLRYERPRAFKLLFSGILCLVSISIFMLIPELPMLRAMGVSDIQKKISAVANGSYWSFRAFLSQEGLSKPQQLYGSIEGVDESGKLIVSIPMDNKWVKQYLRVANTEITDLYGMAQLVGSLRYEAARFDLYEDDQAVVWVRNTPINLKLIESGVAKPAKKPPTNIFDQAFATYYWGVAKATHF